MLFFYGILFFDSVVVNSSSLFVFHKVSIYYLACFSFSSYNLYIYIFFYLYIIFSYIIFSNFCFDCSIFLVSSYEKVFAYCFYNYWFNAYCLLWKYYIRTLSQKIVAACCLLTREFCLCWKYILFFCFLFIYIFTLFFFYRINLTYMWHILNLLIIFYYLNKNKNKYIWIYEFHNVT